MDAPVRVVAPAKVNLFLGVGGTRADGYHDLSTVIHALELADEVTIEPARSLTVRCSPDLCIPAEHNLAWRAATTLGDALGRVPEVSVTIEKRIPHGAGLGGGSSDAAAVIAGLAVLWDVDPLDPRCLRTAGLLGADVPFFLMGGAALMRGRGDVFDKHLPAMQTPVVLVKPETSVSTAEAYRAFDAQPMVAGEPDAVVGALKAGDHARLGAALYNNMTGASVGLVPEVGEALELVTGSEGVSGALVAGSGSAVFGLCADEADAEQIALIARDRGFWSAITRLSQAGVEIVEDWSAR